MMSTYMLRTYQEQLQMLFHLLLPHLVCGLAQSLTVTTQKEHMLEE